MKTVDGEQVEVWQPVMIVYKEIKYVAPYHKYFMQVAAVAVTLRPGTKWCGCAEPTWYNVHELIPYDEVFPGKRKKQRNMEYYYRFMHKHGVKDESGRWRYVPGRKHTKQKGNQFDECLGAESTTTNTDLDHV